MSVIFARLSDWLKRPSVEEERAILHALIKAQREVFEENWRIQDFPAIHASALEIQNLSRQLMLCDKEEGL